MPNYNDWVVKQFAAKLRGRAVEIGAGLGTISGAVCARSWNVSISWNRRPPSPNGFWQFAGDDGCSVAEQTLETWMENSTNETYDAVVMVNVLEHIEDDHAAARGVFTAMKPGGKLLIFVRPCPFCTANWTGYTATFAVTGNENCATASSAGFRIEKLRYFDITGVFPWWLLNTVMGKTSFHQPSLTVYDRILVPPTRLMESILPPPLGKNLILIASKD